VDELDDQFRRENPGAGLAAEEDGAGTKLFACLPAVD